MDQLPKESEEKGGGEIEGGKVEPQLYSLGNLEGGLAFTGLRNIRIRADLRKMIASVQDILNTSRLSVFSVFRVFLWQRCQNHLPKTQGQIMPFSYSKFFLALINYRVVQTSSLLNKGFETPHKLALFGFIIIFQHNRTHHAISHLLAFSQAVLSIWNARPTFSVCENPTHPFRLQFACYTPRKPPPTQLELVALYSVSPQQFVCVFPGSTMHLFKHAFLLLIGKLLKARECILFSLLTSQQPMIFHIFVTH